MSLLQKHEWPRLQIILGSGLKNKIITNEKSSEKSDGFFVVEIVRRDQGVEVLISSKTRNLVHIWS